MTAEEAALASMFQNGRIGYAYAFDTAKLRELGYVIIPVTPSDEMVDIAASAAYWRKVSPYRAGVTLAVAVMPWKDLPEERRSVSTVWLCKEFWRVAARAAYAAIVGGEQ